MPPTAELDIRSVLGYSNERVLERYAKEHRLPMSEAERHFRELMKFLAICAMMPFPCTPSAKMNEVWHNFLLHTSEYYEFCLAEFGRIIHHSPSPFPENVKYRKTRQIAKKMFGELDPELWPDDDFLAADCDSVRRKS